MRRWSNPHPKILESKYNGKSSRRARRILEENRSWSREYRQHEKTSENCEWIRIEEQENAENGEKSEKNEKKWMKTRRKVKSEQAAAIFPRGLRYQRRQRAETQESCKYRGRGISPLCRQEFEKEFREVYIVFVTNLRISPIFHGFEDFIVLLSSIRGFFADFLHQEAENAADFNVESRIVPIFVMDSRKRSSNWSWIREMR